MTITDKQKSGPRDYPGEFEVVVLLAVIRLGPGAYGVTVRDELEEPTSRQLSLGAVYKTLARLEAKGYVTTHIGAPTAERGGRRKKLYEVVAAGRTVLARSLRDIERLSSDLQLEPRG